MKNHFKNNDIKKAERTDKNTGNKKYIKCKTSLDAWKAIKSNAKEKIRRERALFLNSALQSCGIN